MARDGNLCLTLSTQHRFLKGRCSAGNTSGKARDLELESRARSLVVTALEQTVDLLGLFCNRVQNAS